MPAPRSTEGNLLWWLLWLAATIIIPAVLGGWVGGRDLHRQTAVVLIIVCLLLHLWSSVRLDTRMTGLTLYLILGGWPLMAAAFFAGCGNRIGIF